MYSTLIIMEHTKETKSKMSASRVGKNNPFYGKKHTPETKEKLTAVLRRYRSNRTYDLTPRTIRIPCATKLAYLAGLLDGEGSIGFIKKIRPRVSVYNTDRKVMDWLVENVGGKVGQDSARGRVPCMRWSLDAARNVYGLCKAVLPYLIIKKHKAEEVMKFLEVKYGKKL